MLALKHTSTADFTRVLLHEHDDLVVGNIFDVVPRMFRIVVRDFVLGITVWVNYVYCDRVGAVIKGASVA
jgi:hypothetical protein